ncbi:hypothetical protein TL16_g02118 [Triparma laevis f. inornata]|uniref:Ig-like domain-containing protein n=1 Tax=Triparma laevis f. inornata TaxID=1714386 RepID=A0A9W6ZS29_9STRA|nr:hypothetical protein TL16_g02118 [Triparma laevis f. inornata]
MTILLPSDKSISNVLGILIDKSLDAGLDTSALKGDEEHVIRYVNLSYIKTKPTIKTLISNIPLHITFTNSATSPSNNNITTSSGLNTLIELSNSSLGRNLLKKLIILVMAFLENEVSRCTGFVDILKPGGLNYDIVSLMCLAVFCSEGTPVVDTVGLGFKEFLRVWGNFDWRGEGFYFPRGNDGVQLIIDELRKKSVRRKIKKEERGEGGVRFFDPVSGENLGEGVKGECLEFIEGGLREGYRMFCEVEAWVEKEGGGFTPRGLEQVKSSMSNPNSPNRGRHQSPIYTATVNNTVQNATPKGFGASLSPTNLVPPPGLTIPSNEEEDQVSDHWFLSCFFPSSSMLCHYGKCYRPDVVRHPEQNWNEVEPVRFANLEEAEAVLREERNDIFIEEEEGEGGEEKKECPSPQEKRGEKKRKKSKGGEGKGVGVGVGAVSTTTTATTRTTTTQPSSSSNFLWKLITFLSVVSSLYMNFAGVGRGGGILPKTSTTTTKKVVATQNNVPLWVKSGESITLGSPPSESQTYQWSKDSNLLEAETGSFLRLGGVNEDDEAVYSCEVKGDGENHGDVLEVEIRISEPPEVKNNAGYYKVKEGHKFMLSVSSGGMPPPDFQWRLNGVEVEGATSGFYVVDKMSWGDAGTYTCSVGNAAGKVLWEEAVVDVVEREEEEMDL